MAPIVWLHPRYSRFLSASCIGPELGNPSTMRLCDRFMSIKTSVAAFRSNDVCLIVIPKVRRLQSIPTPCVRLNPG